MYGGVQTDSQKKDKLSEDLGRVFLTPAFLPNGNAVQFLQLRLLANYPPDSGDMMNTEIAGSPNTVKEKKEKLLGDIKAVTEDAEQLLKEVANSVAEEYADASTKFESKLDEAKSRLHDARITVASHACVAVNNTRDYVNKNPVKIIAVVAAGILAVLCFSRCSSR